MSTLSDRYSKISTQGVEQVAKGLKTSLDKGLTFEQAKKRQEEYGKNVLPSGARHWLKTLIDQFNSPFIYLLLVICGVMVLLGDATNALIILGIVAVNTVFGFYQEHKAAQSIHLLKSLIVPKIAAIRDGKEQEVATSGIVPGDLLVLYPGDIIPADVRLIRQDHVMVDESTLTGESAPVSKTAEPLSGLVSEISQAHNIIFSGTTIVSGKGLAIVLSIGKNTSLGEIAQLVTQETPPSLFAQGISKISTFMVYLTLITIFLVIIAHIIIARGHLNIFELLVFAAALGVSVIPEALPVVTTFSLTRGAMRLAQHQVVVKRLSAIEDLGSIQVLCTDKTGTLTENKLKVVALYATPERSALQYVALGSGYSGDKMAQAKGFDAAVWNALNAQEKTVLDQYEKKSEIPFDPNRRRSIVASTGPEGAELLVRGAPEEVLSLCDVSESEKKAAWAWAEKQGAFGYRVIAAASKKLSDSFTPEADLKVEEQHMQFRGFVAFDDPLKPTAVDAVRRAKELGVALKILSGDSPEVCAAIGIKVGIISNVRDVIVGKDFELMSHDEKKRALITHSVFARLSPAQKYDMIRILQEDYRVGYMGDGINDAPALRIAHVGLAVDEATDVARDAADIILLHRSLRVVIEGISEGRMTFVNTIKFLKITLAGNLGNFYAVAISSLFIDYLPMLPTQLLLVNLLSDMPLIAISTDTVDDAEIRMPQRYDIRDIALLTITLGAVSTVFDFIIFAWFYRTLPAILQTNWFIASILTEVVFIFSVRTTLPWFRAKLPSAILASLSLLVGALAIGLPYTRFGQTYFHFVSPAFEHLMIIIGTVSVYMVATELVKAWYYRMNKKSS